MAGDTQQVPSDLLAHDHGKEKEDELEFLKKRDVEDIQRFLLDLLDMKLSNLLERKKDTDDIYSEGIFVESFGHEIDRILMIILTQ